MVSPFERLTKAADEAVEIARTQIYRKVYEGFHGSLTPPEQPLDPRAKLEKYGAMRQQDPYYTQFFNERYQFLRDFHKNDRDAAIAAWGDVKSLDTDLERLQRKFNRQQEAIPTVTPGTITQAQGSKHRGWDVAYPTGFPIEAPSDGLVIHAGEDGVSGRYLVIGTHRPDAWVWYFTGLGIEPQVGKGYVTIGHLDSINVETGQPFQVGQVVGAVGSTGTAATAEHMHIEAGMGKPFSRERLMTEDVSSPDVFGLQSLKQGQSEPFVDFNPTPEPVEEPLVDQRPPEPEVELPPPLQPVELPTIRNPEDETLRRYLADLSGV